MKETKFKQTEIGMIPDDWEVKRLGELCNTASGGTPSRENPKNYIGNIKWFTTSELKDCYLYDSNEHISESALNTSSAKLFMPGTLLIAMYGATIGKLGIIETEAATNQACCAITCKKIHRDFLYYCLYCDRDNIISQGYGAGQPNISQNTVKELKIPLPPTLAEQQKIAKALSDVDNVISTLEKLITKKKNLKQGTMQQLLTGKKRLPGFAPTVVEPVETTKFKQTEIGEIPEDWEVKELGEVAKNFTGLTFSPDDVCDYGTLVLRSSNIQNDMLSFNDNVYVNMNIPERAIAHTGDILICVRNGSKRLIGKSALITESANNCAFGAFMTILRTELLNQQFLFYVWQSDLIQKQIEESMGATINQITNKDIRHYLIAYPKSNAEQTAIANVLSSMDKEIEALETKLGKYRNLKTGMMQQLLTGKIRLM